MFDVVSPEIYVILTVFIPLAYLCLWPSEQAWASFSATTEGKLLKGCAVVGVLVLLGGMYLDKDVVNWLGFFIVNASVITAIWGANGRDK